MTAGQPERTGPDAAERHGETRAQREKFMRDAVEACRRLLDVPVVQVERPATLRS